MLLKWIPDEERNMSEFLNATFEMGSNTQLILMLKRRGGSVGGREVNVNRIHKVHSSACDGRTKVALACKPIRQHVPHKSPRPTSYSLYNQIPSPGLFFRSVYSDNRLGSFADLQYLCRGRLCSTISFFLPSSPVIWKPQCLDSLHLPPACSFLAW